MPEQDMAFQANKGKGHPELSGAEKYGKTEKGNMCMRRERAVSNHLKRMK